MFDFRSEYRVKECDHYGGAYWIVEIRPWFECHFSRLAEPALVRFFRDRDLHSTRSNSFSSLEKAEAFANEHATRKSTFDFWLTEKPFNGKHLGKLP